jgi:hypothetical protein
VCGDSPELGLGQLLLQHLVSKEFGGNLYNTAPKSSTAKKSLKGAARKSLHIKSFEDTISVETPNPKA